MKTVEFTGAFHATVVRQVRLKNPSLKPLLYNATIVGRESADFLLPKGNTVIIAPKSQININVELTSRFLHPAKKKAMLLLVSKTASEVRGTTMTFSLKSKVNHIDPADVLKCKSPCYELKKVSLNVTSPFRTDGTFSSESNVLNSTTDVVSEDVLYHKENNSNSCHNAVQPVLCLKCSLTDILEEKLKIPLINEAREKALAIAAQQQMSALEHERRKVTGTLESSSVRVAVAALGLSKIERDALYRPTKYPPKLKSVDYSIEVSMPEYFEIPEKLSIPMSATSRVNFKAFSEEDHQAVKATEPFEFQSPSAINFLQLSKCVNYFYKTF
ncbi:hypothetical protein UY3_10164 [Chelonia mydas]|uniref:MSP domain-containing protein n=1 Tax=Chelonia mydas TaxID=8469 RepID=M7B6B5_CHEMY|nr:hypothetical protein UY3_10164 [Chelonia mydas]